MSSSSSSSDIIADFGDFDLLRDGPEEGSPARF
uniref:Uncharacterized protein n=1 Tax=Arundo donax TaxID=35708 RepID=A0A0A8YDL0_ARUDO